MAGKVGLDCDAYYNTGTFNTPVWTLVPIAQDVTLNFDKGKADLSTRATRWQGNRGTIKKGPADVKILADRADPSYLAFQDSFLNDTILDMAIADGPIATNGTEYFRADYIAFSWKRNEPLTEAVTVDVGLDLAYSAHAPAFVDVGT